ncbi:hypothetical protein C3L33_05875, partial [Rhododendron williamsianum]
MVRDGVRRLRFFRGELGRCSGKYDHTKYYYIGDYSESVLSNLFFSFDQGFGGGGIALSYPLAAAMVKDLKGCIRRYPFVRSADTIIQFCVDEFGVPLTVEKGIHQIDLVGDISGYLSAHPQSPLLSLHHLDFVDPIFPSMGRFQSTNHLMKPRKSTNPVYSNKPSATSSPRTGLSPSRGATRSTFTSKFTRGAC